MIVEGDGRTTHRAIPVQQPNKYATLISQLESNKQDTKSLAQQIYNRFFGEEQESSKLSVFEEGSAHKTKYGRGRVGTQVVVTNDDLGVYAAQFYMGRKQQLNGVIDTATEMVAVEGKPCFTCEWPTYDIGPNIR